MHREPWGAADAPARRGSLARARARATASASREHDSRRARACWLLALFSSLASRATKYSMTSYLHCAHPRAGRGVMAHGRGARMAMGARQGRKVAGRGSRTSRRRCAPTTHDAPRSDLRTRLSLSVPTSPSCASPALRATVRECRLPAIHRPSTATHAAPAVPPTRHRMLPVQSTSRCPASALRRPSVEQTARARRGRLTGRPRSSSRSGSCAPAPSRRSSPPSPRPPRAPPRS